LKYSVVLFNLTNLFFPLAAPFGGQTRRYNLRRRGNHEGTKRREKREKREGREPRRHENTKKKRDEREEREEEDPRRHKRESSWPILPEKSAILIWSNSSILI